MWFIHTMEHYSAIRKDEILPYATMWVDLESITLSEITQMEKDKKYMISFMADIKQKVANKQNKRTHRQQTGGNQRGRSWGRMKRVKGVNYMVTERD